MRILLSLSSVLAGLSASGCHLSQDLSDPQQLQGELLQVASKYQNWGRVDDVAHIAPQLCVALPPPAVRYSESTDDETHGQKLYSVFAKDRDAYVEIAKQSSPVGQVIVKESWIPEETSEVKPGEIDHAKLVRTGTDPNSSRFNPYAAKGGKVFKASKRGDLFIMMKLDPGTPNTDEGWVYGTVTADGKTVTSAGKVESCMKCHQDAKHDRLFGVPTWDFSRRP